MITHVFLSNLPPKGEHVVCTSTNTVNIAKLTVAGVKTSIHAHWKAFIKSDEKTEKTEDVFDGEETKTLCPEPKNHKTPKTQAQESQDPKEAV
jgi:hypothetical protein